MVRCICDICGEKYRTYKEAKKCENKGIIGPQINPGLVLSSNSDNSFIVFYKELKQEGHERNYFGERIDILNSCICTHNPYIIKSSELIKMLGTNEFKSAENNDVEKLSRLIRDNFPGSNTIKGEMERNNIEKLHHNLIFEK